MSELPPVTRARGSFLYTREGGRYLDLDREGGRALFGWSDSRVLTRYRQELARGLTGIFPTYWEKRLIKLLSARFPGFSTRLVREEDNLPLIRPWETPATDTFAVLLPDLGLGVDLVMEKSQVSGTFSSPAHRVAASCAALGSWISHEEPLPVHWNEWEVKPWTRKGPWMSYNGNEDSYKILREVCYKSLIRLPKDPATPICLPWEVLPGERKKWLSCHSITS